MKKRVRKEFTENLYERVRCFFGFSVYKIPNKCDRIKRIMYIFILSAIFLIIINSYFISAASENSCEQCGKGLFNFCTQNKCERIEGCVFISGFIFKNFGSCISGPRLSPSTDINRDIMSDSSFVGVGCEVPVNLSINTNGKKFYVIEEELPNGLILTDNGGGNTSTAGKIKWVKYDNTSALPNTSYTYKTKPLSSGIYSFNGIYTLGDNITHTIGLDDSLDVRQQICGDGNKTCNEQCDDGNMNNDDACDNSCKMHVNVCGDGRVTGTEQCDDGNIITENTCLNYGSFTCVICDALCGNKTIKGQYCGDGITQSQYEQCDDNNTRNGDGCSSTCKNEPYYKVFVTSQTYSGNIGGIYTGGIFGGMYVGDNICTATARNSGQPSASKWVAWLSDSNHNIGERMYSGSAYKTLNGKIVANNWFDLIDGMLVNPINIDEKGNVVQGSVWTGTLNNSKSALGNTNCNNWYANSTAYSGYSGNSSSASGTWTVQVALQCRSLARLYCFEQPWCGNGICESDRYAYESCSSCSRDCGICPSPLPTPTCFLGDTKIATPSGDKKIKDIKEGDIVLSYNEETKEKEKTKVTKTFEHKVSQYLIINNKLKVTSNHPMHINGNWKEIGEAKIGNKIKTKDGEEIIKSIEIMNENVPVYNLEVDKNYNYFAENYLAHNKAEPLIV